MLMRKMVNFSLFFLFGVCMTQAVAAQTTQCRWVLNVWTCDTSNTSNRKPYDYNVTSPMEGFAQGMQIGTVMEEQRKARELEQQQRESVARMESLKVAEANQKDNQRRQVSNLLADGKCSEALDMALSFSDIELATQVKLFCADK
jgi:hypothetical protein